jgi:hypothetical protein
VCGLETAAPSGGSLTASSRRNQPAWATVGVRRWLDRIDPAVWSRAVRRIDQDGPNLLERPAAQAFLREFGKEPSADALAALDDAEDERLHPTLLNGLLEAAVTEESWDLDKSLDEFAILAALLPGGRALERVIHFKAIDVAVPESCRTSDTGLYGCCTSGAYIECATLTQPFASSADVEAALRQRVPSALDRILGRHRRVDAAIELVEQSYYAEHWRTLAQALAATSARGHYLGLGMSP